MKIKWMANRIAQKFLWAQQYPDDLDNEEMFASWDSHEYPERGITAANEPRQISKIVVTNPTQPGILAPGSFTKDVLSNPAEYLKQSIPGYMDDIRKRYEREGKKVSEEKILAQAVKSATKAVESHKGFLEAFRKHIKPGTKILAPASGIGHEQMIAPEYKWTGLEFQEASVDFAKQRNKMVSYENAQNYTWDFLKNMSPEQAMVEMGPDWEENLNDLNFGNKEGDMPEAIYLKHACGGITDSAMKKAVEKKIPMIFIASCCAHRYMGVSHKIIAPHMKFDDYISLTKRSQDKSKPDEAKKAVDEINELRRKYLESHGYHVEKGETAHGPYLIAKLR